MRFAGILDHSSVLWEGISSVAVFNRWLCCSALFLNHCLSIVLFVGEDVQFDPHVCLNSSNHHLPIDFCWIELPLKGVTFLQFLYGDRLEARWCDPWCYRYVREARVVLSKCNSLMNLRGGWLNWRARKDNLTFKAGHLRFNATIDDVL